MLHSIQMVLQIIGVLSVLCLIVLQLWNLFVSVMFDNSVPRVPEDLMQDLSVFFFLTCIGTLMFALYAKTFA